MSFEDRFRAQIHAAGAAVPGEPLSWDETIERACSARRTHLVVAVAAAVAAAVIIGAGAGITLIRADGPSVPPAGNGSPGDGGSPSPTDTPPVETPTTPSPLETSVPPTDASPSPGPAPASQCSSARMDPTLVDLDGLSAEAQAIREEVVAAAVDCDLKGLEFLALGGELWIGAISDDWAPRPPAQRWREEEKAGHEPLRKLVLLLNTLYGIDKLEGTTRYQWPSAAGKAKPTEKDWEILIANGIYTAKEVEILKKNGPYIGYRVVITEDGDWTHFLAGD